MGRVPLLLLSYVSAALALRALNPAVVSLPQEHSPALHRFASASPSAAAMLQPRRSPPVRAAIANVPAESAITKRPFGARRLLNYLWSDHGGVCAKLRLIGALLLLLIAKVFVVRVPLLFKRCLDALTDPGASVLAPASWMILYGLSRAVYTLLQEGRYLLFTPVGQNALRCFMRDAFEHVQALDAGWLASQSTGELSRVFARGVRGMNALLRLLVFNVLPTALEATLVTVLLGRRYGTPFLLASLASLTAFVGWSLCASARARALAAARMRSLPRAHPTASPCARPKLHHQAQNGRAGLPPPRHRIAHGRAPGGTLVAQLHRREARRAPRPAE